ncbi:division plane positioning ATPase MipZ [Candidatus Phycosocius spiralis]|uniref:ATPase n=1 Tax=Candidatus Phycosocius spiralis TaxID=2815099 RepID=A0ABQ4PSE0_9PROT|nr:division plane positioning ATPase MipZ [Candidatus Phycosocius spiralis]GIU65923.1 ATPase [Candidatus Phycosocius spiralis]
MGHVIVVGNEKGGAGKSTISVHIAVACVISGLKVAALDLDRRQRTFERYFENRARWAHTQEIELASPEFHFLVPKHAHQLQETNGEVQDATRTLIDEMCAGHDIVVIDAPGADTPASRVAHACADTLVTPLNDSFVDFDLLAEIDPVTGNIGKPSVYAEMVWQARKIKAATQGQSIDWVLMRNRLSPLDAKNKRRVGDALSTLAQRIGFRVAPGLSERVIYREMFTAGLTLLDLSDEGAAAAFTLSHVAARQELRDLILALNIAPIATAGGIGF